MGSKHSISSAIAGLPPSSGVEAVEDTCSPCFGLSMHLNRARPRSILGDAIVRTGDRDYLAAPLLLLVSNEARVPVGLGGDYFWEALKRRLSLKQFPAHGSF